LVSSQDMFQTHAHITAPGVPDKHYISQNTMKGTDT